MPRKPTWPPKLVKHASGQAAVSINGRYIYLGTWESPQAEIAYQMVLKIGKKLEPFTPPPISANPPQPPTEPSQKEVEPMQQEEPRKESITVAEVCRAFMEDSDKGFERCKSSTDHYRDVAKVLVALFGDTAAAMFNAKNLEEVALAMAQGTWRRKAKSQALITVNRQVTRIRTIWRWAEREELIPAGRWNHVCTSRSLRPTDPRVRVTPKRKATALEDLEAVRAKCSKTTGDMLAFQWWTGMRSIEVRMMRWEEIDTSGDVWVYTVGEKANKLAYRGQPRRVMIGKEAQEIVAGYKREGFVFTARLGEPYSKNGYCQAIRRASKRAGVKVIPYGGRHAAKMRYARELGAEAARTILGHKSISTQEHYGELDLELAKDAARKCG